MQAIFGSHVVVDNWSEEIAVLKRISDAFLASDLSSLTRILQEIAHIFGGVT